MLTPWYYHLSSMLFSFHLPLEIHMAFQWSAECIWDSVSRKQIFIHLVTFAQEFPFNLQTPSLQQPVLPLSPGQQETAGCMFNAVCTIIVFHSMRLLKAKHSTQWHLFVCLPVCHVIAFEKHIQSSPKFQRIVLVSTARNTDFSENQKTWKPHFHYSGPQSVPLVI